MLFRNYGVSVTVPAPHEGKSHKNDIDRCTRLLTVR